MLRAIALGKMVEPYLVSSIIYASTFGLMAIGLTLTYLTTKVPNFAYGSFVTVGAYVSYTIDRLVPSSAYGFFGPVRAYAPSPLAFMLGGLSSITMYLFILRPLAKKGSSLVALMIATFAVDIGFTGIFGIYSDYLSSKYDLIDTTSFYQLGHDFSLFGLPGVFFVTPLALGLITLGLFLLLTKTKFGVAMRAAVENPSLARVLGIDVERVYTFSWFLAGGFAAMSGSFFVITQRGGFDTGSNLIVEIFASSVLGGLSSVYGAVLGGLLIGGSEILLTNVGIALFGPWVNGYQKGIPLLIMIATLLLLPQGVVSIDPQAIVRPARFYVQRLPRPLRYLSRRLPLFIKRYFGRIAS